MTLLYVQHAIGTKGKMIARRIDDPGALPLYVVYLPH